jgi:proline dehydrogenase
LLTVPDAAQRQRLIQRAIEQGQTSDEFKRCEKRLARIFHQCEAART